MHCDICCEEISDDEKHLVVKKYFLDKIIWPIEKRGIITIISIYYSDCYKRDDIMPYSEWYECNYMLPQGIYNRFEILDL